MIKLDRFDLRILSEIQKNGRVTKIALADTIGLSPSPCWTRLRRLESAGIISGYHAKLELRNIAPFSTIFIEVTLSAHNNPTFQRFEKYIKDIDEIVSCFAIGGGIDYMLKVISRDIDAYQRLVDRLLEDDIGIDRYFSYIVTRTIKEISSVPLEALMETAS